MSSNTVDIPQDVVEAPENIYEKDVMGVSEKNQKKVMTVDIAASAIASGDDLIAAVEQTSQETVETLKSKSKEDFVTKRKEVLVGAVEEVAKTDPEQLPRVVAGVQTEVSQMPERMQKPYAPYLNWVNSLEGSHRLSEEERTDMAVNMAFFQSIAKGLDERAWYETGWDILGMMAVPDESYNAAELEANIMGNSQGLKEWLGSEDSLRNIGEFRRSLDPEERYRFDKFLTEEILKVDDNKLQQLDLVMGVLGEDPSLEMFQALEKVELGTTLGLGLGSRILSGIRSLGVLRRLGEAGDVEAAVKVANVVSADKAIAKEAGVAQADAAALGNPLAPDVFNGAPKGVQKAYRDVMIDVDEALDKTTSTLSYSVSPDPETKKALAVATEKHFSKRDDIEHLKVTEGLEGINVEYDVVDADGMRTVREQVRYTVDDLGTFQQKESGFIASTLRGITSPNTLAGKDRDLLVQAAEASTFAKARIGQSYATAIDEALKPVKGNKKSTASVSDMLQLLDGKDITPSYNNLVVEGVGGKRLTDKEFVAFTGVRNVLDHAWFANNEVIKREMELRKVKQVAIGEDVAYAVPNLDAESAYRMFSGDTDNIHIVDDGVAKRGIGLEEIKAEYKNGKVLVKADGDDVNGWFDSDNGKVRYAFVPKGDVLELPTQVLGKVPNYLPKLREDANFFIKYDSDVIVDGRARKTQKTLAYATTQSQAEAYIRKLAKQAHDAGKVFDASKYHIKFDREVAKGAAGSDSISVSGGLIRGKRKSTPLDYAGDYTDAKRTDALDSMQRYMSITADRMALSEWRIEARTRFINDLATEMSVGDAARTTRWEGLRALIEKDVPDLKRRAKLLSSYDQINHMNNIPSKFDQALQGWTKDVAKKLEKVWGGEKIAKHLYRIHDGSPTDIAKGATFNLTLGMYNLVQIPVQLFGATVAMSINPIHATKALPKWLAASALDFTTNEKNARKFMEMMGKKVGFDSKEAIADYEFWRRTGMYESVIRGNADASSIANHLPYDAGVLRRGFDKFVSAGQTPFRMGELSNMRISFFTALEREKALQGKKFKYNDVTLQNVIARTEQYRLNMSGANKAAFQKGIWALPTQFKQIYTKYMEALFGNHFTKGERGKLILGQMALFGFAGVPLLNHFVDGISDLMGVDEAKLSAEQLTAWKRGAVGWVLNDVYDIDALVSGRLTVSADIIDDISRALLDEHTPMIKTVLGASFTSGDKVLDLFQNMHFAGNMVLDEYLAGKELSPAIRAAYNKIGRSLIEIPSSSRKWLAAYELSNSTVTKADGSFLTRAHPELEDIIARAVGFGSQDIDDAYKLRMVQRKQKEYVDTYSRHMVNILHGLAVSIENREEGEAESSQAAASLVQRQIAALDPVTSDLVWKAVYKRISNPKDFKEEVLKRAILDNTGELMSSANNLSILRQKYIEENNLDN